EVGDRHFAGQQERYRSREQPEEQQSAAERLQHGGETKERHQFHGSRAAREPEQLLRAVRDVEKGHDDPEHASQIRLEARCNCATQGVHARTPFPCACARLATRPRASRCARGPDLRENSPTGSIPATPRPPWGVRLSLDATRPARIYTGST